MGGVGTGGNRSGFAAGDGYGRLHGGDGAGVRGWSERGCGRAGGSSADRAGTQCGYRADRLFAGVGGSGDHGGHGVFVVVGVPVSRGRGASPGGVFPGVGGWRDGDGATGDIRRVFAAGRVGAGRAVQVICRGGGRNGLVGGRRGTGSGTPFRCSSGGASGVGRGVRRRGESGWGVERVVGTERVGAATGHSGRVGGCGLVGRGRRRG